MGILQDTLKKYFGYSDFRPGQKEIIESIMDKVDTLAVLPTGGGKSLCYQLPAILLQGCAIVVSPLIALMKDQLDSLANIGVPATSINSSIPFDEIKERLAGVRQGAYKLLYVAPERLENEYFLTLLEDIKISFLAVDEAHCISEWGHDFRPAYLNVAKALDRIKIPAIIALTATATPEVQDDIVKSLNMKKAVCFIRGFDRPNLSYMTETCTDKASRAVKIIKATKAGSSIVYCGSRKKVEEVSAELIKANISAAAYHAGLTADVRKNVQEDFISGRVPVIVATNAFGMGIDKPDVRNVIHCDFTSTLEAYYQEAGRAGRDGKPSTCYMLYKNSDRYLQEFFIRCNFPEIQDFLDVYNALFEYAKQSPDSKVHKNTQQIGEDTQVPIRGVETILDHFEKVGILTRKSLTIKANVKLLATGDEFNEFLTKSSRIRAKAAEALLRSLSGEAFRKPMTIDVPKVIKKFEVIEDDFLDTVKFLNMQNYISFEPVETTGGLTLLKEKTHFSEIPIDFTAFSLRKERANKKLDVVTRYAETEDCKRNFILGYFQDDEAKGVCGRCCSCLKEQKDPGKKVKLGDSIKIILGAIQELDGRFGKLLITDYVRGMKNEKIQKYKLTRGEFFGKLKDLSQPKVLDLISSCVENRQISVSPTQYPTLSLSQAGRRVLTTIGEYVPEPVKPIIEDEKDVQLDGLGMKVKRLRDDLAKREGVQPRAIMSDSAINRLVKEPPKTPREFTNVKGVDVYLGGKYAALFMSLIKESLAREFAKATKKEIPAETNSILALLKAGMEIVDIAKKMDMNKGEVAAFLEKAIDEGEKIDWKKLVNQNVYEIIRDELYKSSRATLAQLRDKTGSSIDVAVLRVVAALVRKSLKIKK